MGKKLTANAKQIIWLWNTYGGHCHYCSKPMVLNGGHNEGRRATREHVVPDSYGGGNNLENLVLACADCNNERGVSLFYCQCRVCEPLVTKFLSKQKNIAEMFNRLINHNKPKIRKNEKGWAVRVGYSNLYFDSFEMCVDFVSSGAMSKKEYQEMKENIA